MADNARDDLQKFLEQYVRETVREQLGYTEGEMDDAAQFLAIPAIEPNPTLISVAVLRTARAQLLGDSYNGRWGDFSYSDHVFLYGMAISCEEDSLGN